MFSGDISVLYIYYFGRNIKYELLACIYMQKMN